MREALFRTRLAELLGGERIGSWIDGVLIEGTGEEIALVDSVSGATLTVYREAGPREAEAAVEAAFTAQRRWAALSASARGELMTRVAAEIRAVATPLAELETAGSGKPIRDTAGEVARVAEMFSYYAGWCDKLHGDVIPVPTSHLNYTLREPVGVAVQITPWNAPLFTAGWQVAPALCAGNGVVLKPSELTPATSLVLARLIEKAGLPKGLVNVLAGTGLAVGETLVAHPRADLVVFVGSQATGARVAEAAGRSLKPCVLELGGKSASIVFPDADLDAAAAGVRLAIFSGAGQSCVAGSRLIVHNSVRGALLDRLKTLTGSLRMGDPLDPAVEVGPIGNAPQWRKIDRMVRDAVAEGAELVLGGARPADTPAEGLFYAPTILDRAAPDMEIACEEVFGPVLTVLGFETETEAIELANATPYGLAGSVWTNNVARAHRVAAQVRAGTFWINSYKAIRVMSPFGGSGASGHGRSSGREGLYAYTRPKSVWVETEREPAHVA